MSLLVNDTCVAQIFIMNCYKHFILHEIYLFDCFDLPLFNESSHIHAAAIYVHCTEMQFAYVIKDHVKWIFVSNIIWTSNNYF